MPGAKTAPLPPPALKTPTSSAVSTGKSDGAPSTVQRRKLKQLHWDKLKAVGEGTVWQAPLPDQPRIDFAELESLFQILENNAAAKRMGGGKSEEVHLVEHRRAHNISIELSGVRKPFAEIKQALLRMDDSALSVEQLQALSRAVPDDSERRDIAAYLQGQHPKYKGQSDASKLGTVERYFAEIGDIPRLGERIACLLFVRTYDATRDQVRPTIQ